MEKDRGFIGAAIVSRVSTLYWQMSLDDKATTKKFDYSRYRNSFGWMYSFFFIRIASIFQYNNKLSKNEVLTPLVIGQDWLKTLKIFYLAFCSGEEPKNT
jgi:hypothetical protein